MANTGQPTKIFEPKKIAQPSWLKQKEENEVVLIQPPPQKSISTWGKKDEKKDDKKSVPGEEPKKMNPPTWLSQKKDDPKPTIIAPPVSRTMAQVKIIGVESDEEKPKISEEKITSISESNDDAQKKADEVTKSPCLTHLASE